jgi:hypothetical protein
MRQAVANMNGRIGVYEMQDKERPVFHATLHRFVGKRMVTGHYMGYPIVDVVTIETTMVLNARTKDHLDLMVQMAAVDGWRNGRVA